MIKHFVGRPEIPKTPHLGVVQGQRLACRVDSPTMGASILGESQMSQESVSLDCEMWVSRFPRRNG